MSSETERPDPSASRDADSASAEQGGERPAGPGEAEPGEATRSVSGSGTSESGAADAKPGGGESASTDSGDTAADTPESGSGSPDADEPAESDTATDRTGDRYTVESEDTRRSPALIATAVALPVALIVAVLVIAVIARQHPTRSPLALGSVPQPQAAGQTCNTLIPALPTGLGSYTKADLAQPAPPATVGWQLPDGGDPVVLRCGLDRPAEFIKSAALQVIDGVNWFEVRDPASGVTSGTWYVVDRGTYIAVTMPDKAGPTPLQDISDAVAKVLPARPIDPAPIPN